MAAVALVACSSSDERATFEDVVEDLEPVVAFADTSDGVEGYYAETYFDAERLLLGSFDGGQVFVIEREGGFVAADAESVEAAVAGALGGDVVTMLEVGGIAVLVLAESEAAVDVVRDAISD